VEDTSIIDLFWARDEVAIQETRQKYNKYLYTCALNILQNDQDAEECVNDTYMKAWESIPPKRPPVFLSYLAKITRNLSINKNKLQRRAKRGGGELTLLLSELSDCVASGATVEQEYESAVVVQAINNWLWSEEKEVRYIFLRRYFHADSIRDIARRCRLSEAKVKTLLFRARKKLKSHLENEGVEL